MMEYRSDLHFYPLWSDLYDELVKEEAVNRRSWHSLDVSHSPMHDVYELLNVTVVFAVPNLELLREEIQPELPWADEHFEERVSGIPYNPPPSHEKWAGHKGNTDFHLDESGKFSHTYPERFWPTMAHTSPEGTENDSYPMLGIRYHYGDLDDVVELMRKNLYTRQAYLPVWFPEDTGAYNRRVPCTLGYHFQFDIKRNVLDMTYMIRSCDFSRHFHNDAYLACRLLLWMSEKLDVKTGDLTMHIMNLHLMRGDLQ